MDDYHLIATTVSSAEVLETLQNHAGRIILIADQSALEVADVYNPTTLVESFGSYKTYQILQLGHARREDLINKWLLANTEGNVSAESVARQRAKISETLNSLIGKSLLPPYPVFVLSVLQNMNLLTPNDSAIGTYGSYYELLIRNALARGRTTLDFNVVSSYLTFFAKNLFDSNQKAMDIGAFRTCHTQFEQLYALHLDRKSMLEDLSECQMLVISDGSISFRYKYVYFYFVASWLRDNIELEETRSTLVALSGSLHIPGNANVMLFLAHLSKNPLIVKVMLESASRFYTDVNFATFNDEVHFLDTLAPDRAMPELDEPDVDANRRDVLERRDEVDERSEEDDYPQTSVQANLDSGDPVQTFAAAFKTIQILGQILRNFPASLDADVKLAITSECYSLGLKALASIYTDLKQIEGELYPYLVENLEAALQGSRKSRRNRSPVMLSLNSLR